MKISQVLQAKNSTFKTFISIKPPIEMPQNNQKNANFYYAPALNTIKEIDITEDDSMKFALLKLKEIKFDRNDVEYIESLGINLPLKSGQEAYEWIKNHNIKVEYQKVSNPKIHAQWLNEDNKIIINEKYKNTKKLAEVIAISEALMHEVGHAKDKDNLSSLQEELECLALNTLAYRYHSKYYLDVLEKSNSDIIKDGVELYSKLFFDKDPKKKALTNRLKEKYGELPLTSTNHINPSFIVQNVLLD